MTTPFIKCSGIVFDPVQPGVLPTNAIYADSVTQALSSKGGTGVSAPIGPASTSSSSVMSKIMHNLSGFPIPKNTPVAKEADGSIAPADAAVNANKTVIGTTQELILNNAQGSVALVGQNVPGALTGLGFTPGDSVYLAVGGGYTTDVSTLMTTADTITRMGYADCAGGVASTTVVDLILFPEVVSA